MKSARQLASAAGFFADANIQSRHPADAAAWVWHPDCALGETAFVRFSLNFELSADETISVHATADQRFQLRVDGEEVGYGPDRGDVARWPVATYALSLKAGSHRCEALVWWLKDEALTGLRVDPALGSVSVQVRPPVAQATWRGGFLLAGEGSFADRLNTGRAAWQVENLTPAITPVQPVFYAYHDIGPEFHVDGRKWNAAVPSYPVEVVASAIAGNPHGVQRPGWRLQAGSLPEQQRAIFTVGRVRSIAHTLTDGPFEENETQHAESDAWTRLFRGAGEINIPPHSERTVLWDFEAYGCGYARLETRGGAGARVRIDWAEALHVAAKRSEVTKSTPKSQRDEIAGKLIVGFGDEFFPSDSSVAFPSFWWRSGRYLRVQVRTQAEPLGLESLKIFTTGYPLGEAAPFRSDDPALDEIGTLCERTIRACAHEVWADCPYYEQMAYVGDSRLAALNNYALFADDRLSRRMLQLFDDSRANHGLVAERAPAAWQQVSVTYSLLWVLMVRDFAWWRDDTGFVRERLRGVRAMMDEVLALRANDGLLHTVPGWPFVDWVPAWNEGCGPGVREGDSCIVNLHLLLALRAQGELETYCGEPELAALAKRRGDQLSEMIVGRYWDNPRGLLADTAEHSSFSEHAQALGVLAGVVPTEGVTKWVDAWLASDDLAQATIYFSFYTMEALRATGRGDALHARMQLWRDVPATGLLTLPEAPEPTRSDCHAWSAHVRWHFAASIAGVRSVAPGFAQVEIAPLLGELRELETEVRHPRGDIKISLRRVGDELSGFIELPASVTGTLRWRDATQSLSAGKNLITLL
ncbi:alpha-L-rhamnosidase-related protein [Oleiharenicola lentus]|uniref:alpha-L-rhamnosidase-related protein n=1 Tax=Oleiharenicola lentus TaxID=2508720 RepID=UPI003F6665D9